MQMGDFGPLGTVVGLAGNLGAACVAIRAAWAGKGLWEPDVRELPKAPTRIAGVLAIVGIAIVFDSTHGAPAPGLADLAIFLSAVAVVAFVLDVVLRSVLIYRCEGETNGVIGGFWLKPEARAILKGKSPHLLEGQPPPSNKKELYCGSGRDPDRIWSRLSQGIGAATLTGFFMLWNASCASSILHTAPKLLSF